MIRVPDIRRTRLPEATRTTDKAAINRRQSGQFLLAADLFADFAGRNIKRCSSEVTTLLSPRPPVSIENLNSH